MGGSTRRLSFKIFDFVGKSQLKIKKRTLNINVCYKKLPSFKTLRLIRVKLGT